MKRIAIMMLTLVFAISLCGCLFSSHISNRKLTTYFDEDAQVISARVFAYGSDGMFIKEASEDQLEELVEEIDSTPLISHFGHTDYFYKGQYGIELGLADGNYLLYDCTGLHLLEIPFDEQENFRYESIKTEYLEDANKDFWDRIEKYFPGMEDCNFSYGW